LYFRVYVRNYSVSLPLNPALSLRQHVWISEPVILHSTWPSIGTILGIVGIKHAIVLSWFALSWASVSEVSLFREWLLNMRSDTDPTLIFVSYVHRYASSI
jgi:hypothetical protein